MDARKDKNGRKTKEEIDDAERELQSAPFDLNYEELQRTLHASTNNITDQLDKLIQSCRPRSQKRLHLELFRALIAENARASESIIYLFECVKDLRASILLLSLETEKTKGKTASQVKRLKSKLDSLLNSPAMVEIGKVLENIQKISEQRNITIGKDPSNEYLR